MSITKYSIQCDYRVGGLKPFIYLIHKNLLNITIKANGADVLWSKTKDGDIYKLNADSCVYNQEETKTNKYRFTNTLEVQVSEQYQEPFLYGLRTLRTNQYYIIVEDKKGSQYLVNPELYTVLNYEYTFSNGGDAINNVLLTWNNLSNFPLLLMTDKIENNYTLLNEECGYNKGEVYKLAMTRFIDLSSNDDGVKVQELYLNNDAKIDNVDFLKDSFTLNETYDGNVFRTTITFSIPLDENQFSWAYNLLEFKDNVYKAIVATTNNNYIICGNDNGLTPSYTIQTSEEDENPNIITVKLEQVSQYPIVYSNDITPYRWFEEGEMCFGFDKYSMLIRQYSEDWGETWIVEEDGVKKKGDIKEEMSPDCYDVRWVDDTYCLTTSIELFEYRDVGKYICEGTKKYNKLEIFSSTDGGDTWITTNEYVVGNLISNDSEDCGGTVVGDEDIKWEVDEEYGVMCYPVNEEYTKIGDYYCDGYNKYGYELVSNNGVDFYKVGTPILVEENSSDCQGGDTSGCVAMGNIHYNQSGDSKLRLNDKQVLHTAEKPIIRTLGELGITTLTSCTSAFTFSEITELISFPSTSNVTKMDYMFYDCTQIESLNLCNFDTSNVTTMTQMFNDCSSLTELDVTSFSTSKVTMMDAMFNDCKKLTELDVSNFNTSNCTNMKGMFQGCSGLTSLDVSNFDTSNVTDMDTMFQGCKSLTSLDVSNFDTSNVTDMTAMFGSCSGLTSLDVSNFDTSNVTDMQAMFQICYGLTSLDLTNFNTSKVIDIREIFFNSYNLTSLNLSTWNTSNLEVLSNAFNSCTNLVTINLSGWDLSNCTYKTNVFYNCTSLNTIYCYGCNQKTIDILNDIKPLKTTLVY